MHRAVLPRREIYSLASGFTVHCPRGPHMECGLKPPVDLGMSPHMHSMHPPPETNPQRLHIFRQWAYGCLPAPGDHHHVDAPTQIIAIQPWERSKQAIFERSPTPPTPQVLKPSARHVFQEQTSITFGSVLCISLSGFQPTVCHGRDRRKERSHGVSSRPASVRFDEAPRATIGWV